LPRPPRCRGIPIGDGNYTGCAYGYGDIEPYAAPCDCPICEGSGVEGNTSTLLSHSDLGNPDCCGCLMAVVRGEEADIVCNECRAVVRTVPSGDLSKTLTEMELALELTTTLCPNCRSVNLFPGFSKIHVFTCSSCGRAVDLVP
jgi:hypothetical protein